MDTEYIVTTRRTENAIVTVRRPILTPEERERRMEKIKQATIEFLTAVEREKAKQRLKEKKEQEEKEKKEKEKA